MPVKTDEVDEETEKAESPMVVKRQETLPLEPTAPPGDPKPVNKSFFNFFRRGNNLQEIVESENQLQVDTTKAISKHPLSKDCHTPISAQTSTEDSITQDSRVSKVGGDSFSEHLMEYDQRTMSTVPSIHISHHLATDPTFVRKNTTDSKHGLGDHESGMSKQYNTGTSHALGSHDLTKSPTEAQKETIEADDTSSQDKGFVASLLSGIPNPLGGSMERPAHGSSPPTGVDEDEKAA